MASASIIGRGTVVRGNVRGDGSLEIQGRVEGDVTVEGDVVLGEEAVVRGNITGTQLSIAGTVQLDSVNTRDSDRDASLLDKDWFNAKQYPEAKFESQKIEKTADGYVANGNLTLKGTTKPAAMKFTFDGSGATAKFAGSLTINRFDFNVGEGWNDTSWVSETVSVEIKLDLKQ